jgi:hypothetical protein
MITSTKTDTAAIASSLLQNPDFIKGLAVALQEYLDPDFRMIYSIDELESDSADYEAGRIKATPWREEKQRRHSAIRT